MTKWLVFLLAAGLAAGCLASARLDGGGDEQAKTRRGRLRALGLGVALLVIAVCVIRFLRAQSRPVAHARGSSFALSATSSSSATLWLVLAILAAGVLVALRWRRALWIVSAALMAAAGYGFVRARDYGNAALYNTVFHAAQPMAVTIPRIVNTAVKAPSPAHRLALSVTLKHATVGFSLPVLSSVVPANNVMSYLVLPLTYAALLLGGWLAWRALDGRSAAVRLVVGKMAEAKKQGRHWGILLLPAAIVTAELLAPNIWFGPGAANIGWTVALVGGTLLLIRRWPVVAAWLATAGLAALGLAGLYLAGSWDSGRWPLPLTPDGSVFYGAVDVSSHAMIYPATVQAVALIALACWLVPRTMPATLRLLGTGSQAELATRVRRLAESRAAAADTAAADLRRLERDLHDGAQARLIALGMNLRAVERLIPTKPEAALALVAEARETSARALTELRELVRGVHPPVLADRGLADAVRALALDCPLRVETDIDLPGRPPAPVETACYFAVAEILTNAAKHSGAREAKVAVSHAEGMLRIAVTDFGVGGADAANGTGLAGVERRLATFDGILAVSSPVGGPSIVVLEVPCALSSPKISSC